GRADVLLFLAEFPGALAPLLGLEVTNAALHGLVDFGLQIGGTGLPARRPQRQQNGQGQRARPCFLVHGIISRAGPEKNVPFLIRIPVGPHPGYLFSARARHPDPSRRGREFPEGALWGLTSPARLSLPGRSMC